MLVINVILYFKSKYISISILLSQLEQIDKKCLDSKLHLKSKVVMLKLAHTLWT